MSHHSEWHPKAGELLDKIVQELCTNDGAQKADSSADHKDLTLAAYAALQRAIGPVFETFTASKDGYSATQTKAQATFFVSFIGEMMGLIAAGFNARVIDQALSTETDAAMDNLINRFGSDEYPASVKQMICRGQEFELQATLAEAMKNAAAVQGDAFFELIAEAAIKRSSASLQTTNIMSMFHQIVEVSIAGNRREIQTSKGPVEATHLAENVIQVNFGGVKPPASDVIKAKPAENIAQ